MKKIFCLVLLVLCMTSTAFASDFNEIPLEEVYPAIPDVPYSYAFYRGEYPYYLFLVPEGKPLPTVIEMNGTKVLHFEYFDSYWAWGDEWEVEASGVEDWSVEIVPYQASPMYSSHTIYDLDGSIVFKGDSTSNDVSSESGAISSAIDGNSLGGALTEVLSMLVYVIPVVIGLFGIRKGISFLIGRIRGV